MSTITTNIASNRCNLFSYFDASKSHNLPLQILGACVIGMMHSTIYTVYIVFIVLFSIQIIALQMNCRLSL